MVEPGARWHRLRRELDGWLSQSGRRQALSLEVQAVERAVRDAISRHARGSCLDAGAGRSPYAAALAERCSTVLRLDREDRGGGLELVGDIQDMAGVESGRFDTVLCTQVLEHVPQPERAVTELARVLAPGGCLILSAPHLSAIHEAPDDYQRFTPFGLEARARAAGLEPLEVVAAGGLLAFLAHPLSLAALAGAGALPGGRTLAWWFNRLALVEALRLLDRWLGWPDRFPCNVVLVARKPRAGGG